MAICFPHRPEAGNTADRAPSGASDFEKQFSESGQTLSELSDTTPSYPQYKHPRKNWRLKQGATPQWYKARNGVRTMALSGAARVARYRPHKIN